MPSRRSPWLLAALVAVGCAKSAEHPEGLGSASAVASGAAAPSASGAGHAASAGASGEGAHGAAPDGSAHAAGDAKAHAHWAYGGHEGPSGWGDLDGEWARCKVGAQQSPIDLPMHAASSGRNKAPPPAATAPARDGAKGTATDGAKAAVKEHGKEAGKQGDKEPAAEPVQGPPLTAAEAKLTVDYLPLPLLIHNNGHAVRLENRSNNYITVGGKRFELLEFHMHSPSEHTVAGKPFDLELHLVHKSATGQLAVLGILFEKGAANEILGELMRKLPKTTSPTPEPIKGKPVDVAALVSLAEGYWHYPGSLTTPPCKEGVLWFVQKKTRTLDERDIEKYRALFGGRTNRTVQALGDRHVLELTP